MKAYKIFSITPSGALRSYNIKGENEETEFFSPLLLKYEVGEWREPEIEGTGIFCTRRPLLENKTKYLEIWEVEGEGQIKFEELVLDICEYKEEVIRSMVEQKRYARREDISFLNDMFPTTVVFKRVKPIRKVEIPAC